MSNLKFADVKAFLSNVKKLGEKEGQGKASRAEFMIDVAIAAQEQHINATPDDAKTVWDTFRKGAAKPEGDLVTEDKFESSYKQRVSNVLQIIKAAATPGVNLSDTLLDGRKILAEEKAAGNTKSNTFDAFVDIARAQLKKGDKDLTEAEIRKAVQPKDKKEKDYNEKIALEKEIAALEKIGKGTEPTENSPGKPAYPSDALTTAIQALRDRVTLLEFREMQVRATAAQARLATPATPAAPAPAAA